jgi:hypothetical protein
LCILNYAKDRGLLEDLYSPRRTGDGITLKYQATHPIGCAALFNQIDLIA